MRHYTFSVRMMVNDGCSGVCVMSVKARNRREALFGCIADVRKMGKRNFCVTEVR